MSPTVSHSSPTVIRTPPAGLPGSASLHSSIASSSSEKIVSEHYTSEKSEDQETLSSFDSTKVQSEVLVMNPESSILDSEETEVTFNVQYYKQRLFHSWVNAFVVIDSQSIKKYPNDRRMERKRKEIMLYDATFSVTD